MLFSIKQYLKYLLKVKLKKDISNPFLTDFIANVLHSKSQVTHVIKIAELEAQYILKNTVISKEDYGAGSRKKNTRQNLNSSQLLKYVSISKKQGVLLHHLAKHYGSKNCIELGTSLGIGTAYLSNENNHIISIEGNKELAKLSRSSLQKIGIKNIEIINAKFDDVLETILKKMVTFDLLFIDGNHTEDATIRYFRMALNNVSNQSIIVFDDINWSIGMKNAWNTIIKHQEVKLSIELFRVGIIFFDKKIRDKEHYTLWH